MLIRKNVLKLALPIMVEQTFVMLLGVCNTMMAGHIGEEAVSAIGMVDSINNMFIAFFAALSVGATVVVAQQIGQENIKKANATVNQALISGIILSLLITIFMFFFKEFIISTCYGSATEGVKENARIYLLFTLMTYPFIAVQQIANGILRGTGDTKTPMFITIFMNIINIILGYILIYGVNFKLGNAILVSRSFGIKGAAMAIAIARLVGTIIILFLLHKGSGVIRVRKLFPFKLDMITQRNIFNIGIPAGVEQVLFNGGKLIVQVFIVTMGTISIASNTIGMSITQIINVIGNSLTLAATTLVGQYIGKDNVKEAKEVMIYLTKFATVCMVFLGIIFIPIAPVIAGLYSNNKEVIDLSSTLIRSNSLAMLIWPMAFVLSAGLKGAGDTRYTMLTAFIGMWLFRICVGYLLAVVLKIGVLGIWIGMYSDWLIRGFMYIRRLKGNKWLSHRIAKDEDDMIEKKTINIKI